MFNTHYFSKRRECWDWCHLRLTLNTSLSGSSEKNWKDPLTFTFYHTSPSGNDERLGYEHSGVTTVETTRSSRFPTGNPLKCPIFLQNNFEYLHLLEHVSCVIPTLYVPLKIILNKRVEDDEASGLIVKLPFLTRTLRCGTTSFKSVAKSFVLLCRSHCHQDIC